MKIQKKKVISIFVTSVIVVIVLCNSVYFQKLDTRREKEEVKKFNPKEKVEYFWNTKRDKVLESAIDLKKFDTLLSANPEKLIDQYGKSVGITSTFSFLVQSYAEYMPTKSGKIPIKISNSNVDYQLRIKFIFGNSARDASGFFKIDDFENTMDFNAVATELNKLILTRVIIKLDSMTAGETIKFCGAIEINSDNIPKEIDIIPLEIEVVNE